MGRIPCTPLCQAVDSLISFVLRAADLRDEEADAQRSFKAPVCLTPNTGLVPARSVSPICKVCFPINRVSFEFMEQGRRRYF